MRGESHRKLGQYLAGKYMTNIPDICIRAFLLGCIQPDRNPITYLKGSVREQWLRGHNYRNAKQFMTRISRRLERKVNWSLFDFYTLGKLIHYTADAFTAAHNEDFSENLRIHQEYEHALQEYFLKYLQTDPQINVCFAKTAMDTIHRSHREYRRYSGDIHRDAHFSLSVCCGILMHMFPQATL